MAWTLARLTADLTDDGAWHGLARTASTAPVSTGATSIFFPVGGQGAKVFGDLEILVRVGWCNATGSPLAGQGTALDAEPVVIDRLPHPLQPTQEIDHISVGDLHLLSAWVPLYMRVGPAALATVRLSNIDATGVTGAARVAVWYWG